MAGGGVTAGGAGLTVTNRVGGGVVVAASLGVESEAGGSVWAARKVGAGADTPVCQEVGPWLWMANASKPPRTARPPAPNKARIVLV